MGEAAVSDDDWVLLAAEAERLKFRNARSFRRWCRSRGVPIRKDGRREWVKHCDVQAAVNGLCSTPANNDVTHALGKLMGIN